MAHGENSPELSDPAFQGWIRAEIGSGGIYAARVVHLGQDLGTSGSVAARTMTGAEAARRHRRRAAFGPCWAQVWTPKGASVRAMPAQVWARPERVRAVLHEVDGRARRKCWREVDGHLGCTRGPKA